MAIKPIGGSDPVLIYGRPAYGRAGQPFLVANLDLVNPLYYNSELTLDSLSSQIQPLGTVGFDGELDVWASTRIPGTTVLADYIPGGTQWSASPAEIAAQIALGGVFLTANPVTLLQRTGVSLPAATTVQLTQPTASIAQVTQYLLSMQLTPGISTTFPFARITLLEQDVTGSGTEEDWIVPMMGIYTVGATGGQGEPGGQGPLAGQTLIVLIRSLDSVAGTLNFLTVSGNSRPAPAASQWQDNPNNRAYAGSPYTKPPIGNGFDMILGAQNSGTLAPAATVAYLLGLWAGPVIFTFAATGGTAGKITFTLQAVTQGGGVLTLLSGTSGAGAVTGPLQIIAPRSPLILTITSAETVTSDALVWSAIAQANV